MLTTVFRVAGRLGLVGGPRGVHQSSESRNFLWPTSLV